MSVELEATLQAAWQARHGLDIRPEVADAAAHAAEAVAYLGYDGAEAVEVGLLDMGQYLVALEERRGGGVR